MIGRWEELAVVLMLKTNEPPWRGDTQPVYQYSAYSGSVASIRRGSIRQTFPASKFVSHTEPRPTRIASPPLPANCCTTLFDPGSMRVIGNPNAVTQTDPSPTAISPPPPGTPASIVATTLFVFTST